MFYKFDTVPCRANSIGETYEMRHKLVERRRYWRFAEKSAVINTMRRRAFLLT